MYLPPVLLTLWNIDLLVFSNAVPVAAALRSLELIQQVGVARLRDLLHAGRDRARATPIGRSAAAGKKQIKWIYLGVALGFLPFLAHLHHPVPRQSAR